MMHEEIARKIIGRRRLSQADIELINAFAFASSMRVQAMQRALDSSDDSEIVQAMKEERTYAQELRAWADKRRDLFGDTQAKTADEDDEEQKRIAAELEELKRDAK